MSWPYPRSSRSTIPPMGQGLAVIVALSLVVLASIVGVAGYLWSLHVVARHEQGVALDRRLDAARRQLHVLQLEYSIRSRLPELERWSGTLGLSPTDSLQYAYGLRQLDAVAATRKAALEGHALVVVDPCAGPAHGGCGGGPVAGHDGYAPVARARMDDLIGSVAG
jgi:hypothetical protein